MFLTEKEDAYIEFLKLKKVPLEELPENLAGTPLPAAGENGIAEGGSDIVRQIKDATMKSRDILEKGTRAYTSYVRAYKEHQCGFIFRYVMTKLSFWKVRGFYDSQLEAPKRWLQYCCWSG